MYPRICDIPKELEELQGNCGPVSVWMVLQKLGVKASPEEVIRKCEHTLEYGSFAICMANSLHEFGLNVEFFTDYDAAPKPIEVKGYKKAEDTISVNKAISMAKLAKKLNEGKSCIVSYMARGREGHFSPVEAVVGNKLILAYETEHVILKSEFQYRWRAPEILRQCIFAT